MVARQPVIYCSPVGAIVGREKYASVGCCCKNISAAGGKAYYITTIRTIGLCPYRITCQIPKRKGKECKQFFHAVYFIRLLFVQLFGRCCLLLLITDLTMLPATSIIL